MRAPFLFCRRAGCQTLEYTAYRCVILPSLLTTTVATIIHFFSGTPNLMTTSATIFGLALFNFVMLSEIHKRHETISPWELAKTFYSFLVESMKQIKVKVTSNV